MGENAYLAFKWVPSLATVCVCVCVMEIVKYTLSLCVCMSVFA